MKTKLILLLLKLASMQMAAQFHLNASVVGGLNTGSTFGAFRDKYNETNAATLKNNLGSLGTFSGVNLELNYRIRGLTSALGRSYIHSGTSAKFQNGAKRLVDVDYKLTHILIGSGFGVGEHSEMRVEVGMVHSVSSIYSRVKLPTGEVDYVYGVASHQSTWTNIGLCGKVSFYKHVKSNVYAYGSVLFQRLMANDTGFAPALQYFGTEFTHTYQGFLLNVGIALKLVERID